MRDSRIRPIAPGDVAAVVNLVYELAEYERLRELCHLTAQQLDAALFGPTPALFGLVAVSPWPPPVDAASGSGPPQAAVESIVGYALYFLNFSTWEGVHGIYLEDLYVRPDQRGSGLGRSLLIALAGIAGERGYARVEWSVLDWNAPSIAFYRSLGAEPMDGWTVFRLTGPALKKAAEIG
jgi:GNAT superfamily N-acetyltransferase